MMRILLLAPQPLYSERGSPIAVMQVLEALSERGEQVDVVTYHLGEDVVCDGIAFHRIPKVPFVRHVRPGFSFAKVVCDVVMMCKMLLMALRGGYDLVHAVEEGVFMALILNKLLGLPYVYDMDSSLVQQMIDQFPRLRGNRRYLKFFERLAVQNALAVVPVCPALGDIATGYGHENVSVIGDVPLQHALALRQVAENLTETWHVEHPILLYVGNLEPYQGIDLMLGAFELALKRDALAYLVVVGGDQTKIVEYQMRCEALGISDMVRFVGPRPIAMLGDLLEQADILVSPRIQGNNTPMKLYSYLASGRPVLATNLPTHTQVVDSRTALLVDPDPAAMAEGMTALIKDPDLRLGLGIAGQRLSQGYTFLSFRARMNELYDGLARGLDKEASLSHDVRPSLGRRSH